jgi:hypothetical protein
MVHVQQSVAMSTYDREGMQAVIRIGMSFMRVPPL